MVIGITSLSFACEDLETGGDGPADFEGEGDVCAGSINVAIANMAPFGTLFALSPSFWLMSGTGNRGS